MHDPSRVAIVTLLCLVGAAALPAGCAGGPGAGGPVAVAPFDDADAPERARLADLERLRSASPLPSDTREGLKGLAWKRSESPSLRIAAINTLLADDEADTRAMLALLLPTETAWPVIERACALAGERGWTDLTPALVRSWSRTVPTPPDDERPERAALLALFPGEELEAVVFGVFADRSLTGAFAERTRQDAWALLRRLDPGDEASVALLRGLPAGQEDTLVEDIRRAAVDLHAIPETSKQLEWVRDMRRPEHADFWREATEAIAALDDARRAGLALRHASVVRWVAANEPSWLERSREELLAILDERLAGRRRHERTGGGDAVGARMEHLSRWRDELTWGDAAAILLADITLRDGAVVQRLFDQADADHLDRSCEHGGVLAFEGGAWAAIGFEPRPAQRLGDRRFIAPPEMLERGATAPLLYHFHANRHGNTEYAGPSEGDLVFAEEYGRACLVLTFVDPGTLAVDYYQPGGARIDLGELSRP
jgi:hypothetical protein